MDRVRITHKTHETHKSLGKYLTSIDGIEVNGKKIYSTRTVGNRKRYSVSMTPNFVASVR